MSHIRSALRIRLALIGCKNRPFYQMVVMPQHRARDAKYVEQIGSFDPMPNTNNEKLVAINFERLNYWLAKGALPSQQVENMLGLCGYLPLHPMTYIEAKRNRKKAEENAKKQQEAQLEAAQNSEAQPEAAQNSQERAS